eukprot:gene10213-11899_t
MSTGCGLDSRRSITSVLTPHIDGSNLVMSWVYATQQNPKIKESGASRWLVSFIFLPLKLATITAPAKTNSAQPPPDVASARAPPAAPDNNIFSQVPFVQTISSNKQTAGTQPQINSFILNDEFDDSHLTDKQKSRRRASQNLASRNYRQRKKVYINEIEDKLAGIVADNDRLKRELTESRKIVKRLMNENNILRAGGTVPSHKSDIPGCTGEETDEENDPIEMAPNPTEPQVDISVLIDRLEISTQNNGNTGATATQNNDLQDHISNTLKSKHNVYTDQIKQIVNPCTQAKLVLLEAADSQPAPAICPNNNISASLMPESDMSLDIPSSPSVYGGGASNQQWWSGYVFEAGLNDLQVQRIKQLKQDSSTQNHKLKKERHAMNKEVREYYHSKIFNFGKNTSPGAATPNHNSDSSPSQRMLDDDSPNQQSYVSALGELLESIKENLEQEKSLLLLTYEQLGLILSPYQEALLITKTTPCTVYVSPAGAVYNSTALTCGQSNSTVACASIADALLQCAGSSVVTVLLMPGTYGAANNSAITVYNQTLCISSAVYASPSNVIIDLSQAIAPFITLVEPSPAPPSPAPPPPSPPNTNSTIITTTTPSTVSTTISLNNIQFNNGVSSGYPSVASITSELSIYSVNITSCHFLNHTSDASHRRLGNSTTASSEENNNAASSDSIPNDPYGILNFTSLPAAGKQVTVDIVSCVFSGNSLQGNGFITVAQVHSLTMSNCSIHTNSLLQNPSTSATVSAALVYGLASGVTVNNSTFQNNNGPCIATFNSTSLLVISNTNFIANSALDYGSVQVDGGMLMIDSSLFLNNLAENGPALYVNDISFNSVTVQNTFFTNNTARANGGAIFGNSVQISFMNCTITGNTAEFGGSILCHDSTFILRDTTINHNMATNDTDPEVMGVACQDKCQFLNNGLDTSLCPTPYNPNEYVINLTRAEVAGIVIGVLAGVILITVLVVVLIKRASRNPYRPF